MSHCRVWVSAIDSASDSDSHSEKSQAPLAMCNLALIYISWHSKLIHVIISHFIHCSNFGLYDIIILAILTTINAMYEIDDSHVTSLE